jgi:hypothetical protein
MINIKKNWQNRGRNQRMMITRKMRSDSKGNELHECHYGVAVVYHFSWADCVVSFFDQSIPKCSKVEIGKYKLLLLESVQDSLIE